MGKFKNLEEIIELCSEELDENSEYYDENVHATFDFEDLKDLENLINKNKELLEKVNYLEEIRANQTYENEELEKMVEEMASFIEVAELDEDIAKTYCKNEACTEINKFNCQKCIIDYFRKKAKGE